MKDEYVGTRYGKCHICKQPRAVLYCPVCDHWFCAKCRFKWWPTPSIAH